MALSPEDRLTDWLRARTPDSSLGDDVARLGRLGDSVATVDHQIEGVHFPADLAPAAVARRLLAVNLSDLAASGARPRHALLALAARPDFDHRQFLTALVRACERSGVTLVGGDTATTDRTSLSLCLVGDRWPGGRFVGRDTARPGDRLWLGGSLGESALGRALIEAGASVNGRRVEIPERLFSSRPLLREARRAVRRHLAPTAQVELGRWLSRRPRAAAIDVSDGFSLDLARLCRESGVGARIEADRLPLPVAAGEVAGRLGTDPLSAALAGGEDYVLLFAVPEGSRPPKDLDCRTIGEITRRPDLILRHADRDEPLAPRGWSHLDS